MGRGKTVVLVVLALALAAPAGAAATPTIAVENGAIRYVGDAGDNFLEVTAVEGDELWIWAQGATVGAGCHRDSPDSDYLHCTRTGVSRFEFVGGDGADTLTERSFLKADTTVRADMGDGQDRVDFGSAGVDLIQLGDGPDAYVDAPGNDFVDGGPGNDDMYGGDFSSGNDVLIGGDGDDNLDALAGDDTIDGGPGNDIIQFGDGNDTTSGGPGDDLMGGLVGGCGGDVGDDTMRGGPGNDQLCGGPGVDTLDGGDGNDAINAVDSGTDGPITCGAGADAAWADASDNVAVDCELQDNRRTVTLPAPNVLPVPLPCQKGACSGELKIFATPSAARPDPAKPPPLSSPKAVGKALAKSKFKLTKTSRRSIRVHLSKAATKRLRKLGKTTVEARVAFTQRGKRRVVRRTFRVRPK